MNVWESMAGIKTVSIKLIKCEKINAKVKKWGREEIYIQSPLTSGSSAFMQQNK